MPRPGVDTQYQLKLKEGDLIQVTITSAGHHGVKVDTSEWANIDAVEFVTLKSNPSPGTDVYAKVTNINSNTADLTQERGIYNRNHLPGDLIRVFGVESVSTNLCKAVMKQSRNLESLYVVGIIPGTDVTVQIQKIRGETAVAFPTEIHQNGIHPGQSITLNTTAGMQEADLVGLNEKDDRDIASQLNIQIELSDPACATGPAQATVTELEGNTAVAKIESYPADLPVPDRTIEAKVKKGQTSTTVPIENTDVEILVEFTHPAPINGTSLVELNQLEQGVYQAVLQEYTTPPVSIGERFDGIVYASQNTGRIKYAGNEFKVTLTKDISTSGNATMQIVNISDHIEAKIIGEIEPTSIDDTEKTNIDLTNLSKL